MTHPDGPTEESTEPSRDYQAPAWDSWADTPDQFPANRSGEGTQSWSSESATAGGSPTADDDLDQTQRWNSPLHFDDAPGGWEGEGTQVIGTGVTDTASGSGAPTDPVDAPPPSARPGQVIADRYRLEEALVNRHGVWTWRAFDLKLSRAVLVHVLAARDARTDAVLRAARRAAVATDSRFMRVLDAVPADGDQDAYAICEYIDGMSLEVMLRQGPLSGLEAAWVVRELADALTPMHAQGLFHQSLDPDSVLISPTGNVKIVGFLIDAALAGDDPTLPPGPGGTEWAQAEEADVHALGQLLYACLVNRWPTVEASEELHYSMHSAPADTQGWLTPRQVRGGVSPALDAICDQILHEVPRLGGAPMRTVSQIDQSLSRALGTADASSDLEQRVRHPRVAGEAPAVAAAAPTSAAEQTSVQQAVTPQQSAASTTPEPQPEPSIPLNGGGPEHPQPRPVTGRPWLRILIGLVAVALVIGLVVNALRSGSKETAEPTTSAVSTAPVMLPVAKVDDFDPEADGGNGEENPNDVAKAWDKDPKTAWTTLTYLNQAKLGGLKPGVGLVVDLGQSVDVGAVKLVLQGSPTAVSLYVPAKDAGTNAPMTGIKDWKQVASTAKAGTAATLKPAKPVSTRYVLVYLSSLPNVGGNKYRGAIADIQVTS